MHTHAYKTLKPGLAKYAVDANLLRLGSTNPKKNIQPLVIYLVEGEVFKKMFSCLTKYKFLTFFIFKRVQISMTDAECTETNEKSIF